MKTKIHTFVLVTLSTFILITPFFVQAAGGDYRNALTPGGSRAANVGDAGGAVNPGIFRFNLPTDATNDTAEIVFASRNVEFSSNELYINPSAELCTDDGAAQEPSGSIGKIEDYDADVDMTDDFFTEHLRVSGSRLLPGVQNTVMFCARNEDGNVQGNADDFRIRDVFVHFRRTSP